MTSKIIVFDLDGTLCDVSMRRGFVQTSPKNWPAFNAGIANDPPHVEIVWLAQVFHALGHKIILCSGREDKFRDVSVDWLIKNGVIYEKLYMRQSKDNRSDAIVKSELLDQIIEEYGNPFLWFDDRNQVVDMLRSRGIKVAQVEYGDF